MRPRSRQVPRTRLLPDRWSGRRPSFHQLIVNGSDVVLDDIWAGRPDHGTGMGSTVNIVNNADHGVIVNGNNVSAYGLLVPHDQKTEVTWNGQGAVVIFQNEMPSQVVTYLEKARWPTRSRSAEGSDPFPGRRPAQIRLRRRSTITR